MPFSKEKMNIKTEGGLNIQISIREIFFSFSDYFPSSLLAGGLAKLCLIFFLFNFLSGKSRISLPAFLFWLRRLSFIFFTQISPLFYEQAINNKKMPFVSSSLSCRLHPIGLTCERPFWSIPRSFRARCIEISYSELFKVSLAFTWLIPS